jgi:Predicted membrane protein (DUF2157)
MTTQDRLDEWERSGIITHAQHGTLARLVRRERVSLFLELNALLYIGVIALIAGLGWTVQTYFTSLGDTFILVVLTLMLAGSLLYCFWRAPAFSAGEVESPNFVFDYVLYLACLVLSVELGYVEFRFEWLKEAWESYLLFSSIVFFIFAYRFDNRLVLSLALSTLAGWCGLRFTRIGFISSESLRITAIAYGAIISIIGVFLFRWGVKRHFLETYLHVAANVVFIALVSGVWERNGLLFLGGLILLAATAIALGVRFRRFAFVVYGTVFGYIGLSAELLRGLAGPTVQLLYVVVSATAVIISIALLARRFGRDE